MLLLLSFAALVALGQLDGGSVRSAGAASNSRGTRRRRAAMRTSGSSSESVGFFSKSRRQICGRRIFTSRCRGGTRMVR